MLTIQEGIILRQKCDAIEEEIRAVRPLLPKGVRADLGHNTGERQRSMGLSVRIFDDVVSDVPGTREAVEKILAARSLSSRKIFYEIVVTNVAKMRQILGEGWNYGDELRGVSKRRKKQSENEEG